MPSDDEQAMSGFEFQVHFQRMPRIDLTRLPNGLVMRVTTVGNTDFCQPIAVYCTGLDAATIEAAATAFNEAVARSTYIARAEAMEDA